MIMIDAVNDDYKAAVIGKLFRAFVKDDIKTINNPAASSGVWDELDNCHQMVNCRSLRLCPWFLT